MFPFLPFGDRVIIKVKNEYPKKEIKGIVVPKIVKNPSLQGTVVAVGTGRISNSGNMLPVKVQVNDEVVCIPYAGERFRYKGDEYEVIEEEYVIGLLQEVA